MFLPSPVEAETEPRPLLVESDAFKSNALFYPKSKERGEMHTMSVTR